MIGYVGCTGHASATTSTSRSGSTAAPSIRWATCRPRSSHRRRRLLGGGRCRYELRAAGRDAVLAASGRPGTADVRSAPAAQRPQPISPARAPRRAGRAAAVVAFLRVGGARRLRRAARSAPRRPSSDRRSSVGAERRPPRPPPPRSAARRDAVADDPGAAAARRAGDARRGGRPGGGRRRRRRRRARATTPPGPTAGRRPRPDPADDRRRRPRRRPAATVGRPGRRSIDGVDRATHRLDLGLGRGDRAGRPTRSTDARSDGAGGRRPRSTSVERRQRHDQRLLGRGH